MVSRLAEAAAAFETTLAEVGLTGAEPELENAVEFGQRAALLAAAATLWREHLGPLLDVSQVQRLLKVRSRQAVHDLVQRRRILALQTEDRRTLIPAFQFTEAGRPFPAIHAVLEAFDNVVDPWTIASWFVTSTVSLGGKRPIDVLKAGEDPEIVVDLANEVAASLRW